ncbi:MAG: phosphonate ABC transporter, permease protein PhnE [Crocosphaera sp.]
MSKLPPKPFNWPLVIFALVLFLTIICLVYLQLPFGELLRSGENIMEYLSRYNHPDFSELPKYLWLMLVTVIIAFWGTVLSLTLSFFLAPIGAKNLSPHPFIYRIVRELLNFCRAMPDLVLALIFVAALGLGPLPGFLALGIHTTGFLGKFLAESMERVDKGIYEGVSATGTNTLQLIMYAAWPSILQEVIGYTLYIFDRNVRMATVLGLVGAGGIGVELNTTLRFFNYDKSATLILIILITIIGIDYLSTWLRKQVL